MPKKINHEAIDGIIELPPLQATPLTTYQRKHIQKRLLRGETLQKVSHDMRLELRLVQECKAHPDFMKGMIVETANMDAHWASEASGALIRVILEGAHRMEQDLINAPDSRISPREIKEIAAAAAMMRKVSTDIVRAKPPEEEQDDELERAIQRVAGKQVMAAQQKEMREAGVTEAKATWQPASGDQIEPKIQKWTDLARKPVIIDSMKPVEEGERPF